MSKTVWAIWKYHHFNAVAICETEEIAQKLAKKWYDEGASVKSFKYYRISEMNIITDADVMLDVINDEFNLVLVVKEVKVEND